MQSLLSGNIEQMRALTPEVLEILLRSVERCQRMVRNTVSAHSPD